MSVEVRGVALRYGDTHALRGVDLDVPAGSTVALLGPSGCGKSTLLRVLAGLERPDTGTVAMAGRDVSRVPPQRRGVGMVFQDFALFPHLDVAANVAFGLVEQGWERRAREARVEEVLDLVGLVGMGTRRPDTLSGGQRQRVALARALAPRPALLLLDEPLSNLDRALRDTLTGELRALLSGLDIQALHVTHDQREALALADAVALMREGRIVQVAPPDTLLAAPCDVWSASFLGLREIVPEGVARTLGFEGPMLVRVERLRLDPDGASFVVKHVERVEHDLEFLLATATWPFSVRWRARPREFDGAPPAAGDVLRLRVPDDAWVPLGVRA